MDLNPIDVQRHLKGVSYPASRDDLVSAARDNGASDEIVSALEASTTASTPGRIR